MNGTITKAIQVFAVVWLSAASASFGAFGIYTNVVLNDGPVAYWRLGESSGTTAFDETAFNNHGAYTTNQPSGYPAGVVTLGAPGAVLYDPNTGIDVNSGGRVEVPHSASLNLSTGMTIEAWASLESPTVAPPNYYQPLVMKSPGSWGSGYGIYAYQGEIFVYIDTYNPLSFKTASTPLGFGTQYHHFVGTFDGTLLKLYVDGTLKATTTPGVATISQNTDSLIIGAGAGIPFYASWDGKIDEVAIYNYALSAEQVYDHFHSAPEPSVVGLLCLSALLLWKRR
jgi:hypothetical protein